jgi:preprotein translocase subunit SecD
VRTDAKRHTGKKTGFVSPLLLALGLTTFPGVVAAGEVISVDVVRAEAHPDSPRLSNDSVVDLFMTDASKLAFAEFSARNVGKQLDVRVNGRTVMKPVIREPITGGRITIAGAFSASDAKQLAENLMSGSAKVEMEIMPDTRNYPGLAEP